MSFQIIKNSLNIIAFLGLSSLISSTASAEPLSIIATNFPQYDLVKHIVKDKAQVKMLLKTGAEAHSFEPSPQDLIDISKASLFVYNGGENDEWVDNFLEGTDVKPETFAFTEQVVLREEESIQGMQEDEHHHHGDEAEEHHDHAHSHADHDHEEVEFDEHVWTSPKNNIVLIDKLLAKISSLDPENQEFYKKNAQTYSQEFSDLDKEFTKLIENAPVKTVIFGDRFPLLYFVKDYGLGYFAAFKGCSNETEVSASTLKFLIDKAKDTKAKVIFKIELSSSDIADTVAEAAGARVLTFQTGHNLTVEEFKAGKSLADLYNEDLKVLKEALY